MIPSMKQHIKHLSKTKNSSTWRWGAAHWVAFNAPFYDVNEDTVTGGLK